MSEPMIVCPNCKTEVKLTESLAAPLLEATKRDFEKRMADKDIYLAERERLTNEAKAELLKEKTALDQTIRDRVKASSVELTAAAEKRAKDEVASRMAEQNNYIGELNAKLSVAQQAQAELVRKERELEDAKREMDLNIEKQVSSGLDAVRTKAKAEAEEGLKLKVMEKEELIASMTRQIEDLKRKAEQGSQQLQGEVQEMQVEALLKAKFPLDIITPVPKGVHGGDILQVVMSASGLGACGTILWESKRTKTWSDGWLAKLKDDQRAAKAEVAIIVTTAMPKGVLSFELIEGVWVTPPETALAVATALRLGLTDVTLAKKAQEGQGTKMEMVYTYLTGPRFKQRVQAIVEAFSSMKEDLDKERKAITKQWAKREEQIERVMQSTVGMYGDLQGIAGKSIQEVEGLELQALPAPVLVGSGG